MPTIYEYWLAELSEYLPKSIVAPYNMIIAISAMLDNKHFATAFTLYFSIKNNGQIIINKVLNISPHALPINIHKTKQITELTNDNAIVFIQLV
ncbi:MAG: hypothetical protein RR848_08510, partial [Oscillospiraceae bacterium]